MSEQKAATFPPNNAINLDTLAVVLGADPVSCEIVQFLVRNESAMDSAKGIATWWLHRDELAVQPSLQRLFVSGAIVAYTLCSGITVYGLTQNPDVRTWLRNAVGRLGDQRVTTHRQAGQKMATGPQVLPG